MDEIEIGFQAFLADGGEEFGAIRRVTGQDVVVYVENAGEFAVPRDAIHAVHSQKVLFRRDNLDRDLLEAIAHAHDAEQPGL